MTHKLLIIEDEPIVAMDLQQELEEMGCEITGLAESADAALRSVEECRPDLALMDIRIDGTLDGIQTARLFRHAYQIPVVFLTSFSDKDTLAQAARELPYGFLTKPFKSRDLQATLTMALRKSAADAGMQRSNGLMNMTMHATHEAIVFVAADGVIEFMNQPAEQMSGLKLLRARGMLFSEVFNLIEIDARPIPLPANSGNSASIEEFGWFLWVPGRDPLIVDFTIRPVVAYGGSLGGNVVTLRNAAQRMRKSLIEASTKETACFDNAPMSMVQLDGEGHVLRVNQMLLKESGLPMELLVGRSLTDLLADHDPRITRQFISRLLRPFPPAQCLSA